MAKAIYRIYRPKNFKEVSGQEHVVKTIQNQHASDSVAHAYLFTGPRGVGKTTIARLLSKLVNCEDSKENEPCNTCNACEQVSAGNSLDVFEIDAASHTDVENVRENIIKSVRFAPNQLKKKVYIIDEVHMLSTSAFNALLKTLEEPPEHALFVLATTEIHKVPDTIISRCQRFDFKRIDADELVARLGRIIKSEGVEIDEGVLREIVRHSDGCARDAESLLGQVLALGDKKIGMTEASLVLPASNMVQVMELIELILKRDAAGAIALLNTVIEQGMDLPYFVGDLVGALRDKLLETVSSGGDTALLSYAVSELLDAKAKIKFSHIPQLPIELAIVKIGGGGGVQKAAPVDFKQQGVDSSQVPASVVKEVVPEVKLVEQPVEQPVELQVVPEAEAAAVIAAAVEAAEVTGDAEKVFDTVPVIDIDEIKRKWPQVYEQIKQCNASLPMMMKSCEVHGIDGESVELSFDYDLYVQTVNQEKNRKTIEGVLEQVLGKKLKIRAIQAKRGEADEVVNDLLTEFGGTVV